MCASSCTQAAYSAGPQVPWTTPPLPESSDERREARSDIAHVGTAAVSSRLTIVVHLPGEVVGPRQPAPFRHAPGVMT